MIKATGTMNENLHHSQLSDTSSHNGGGSGYGNLELEKMNPLGELNFFFGERSASNSQQQRPQQQQQQQNNQQQPGKRSMDDVLKKLSSKMHISHSPDEEMDPFTIKDRSVSESYFPRPTHVSFPIYTYGHRQLVPYKSIEMSELSQSGWTAGTATRQKIWAFHPNNNSEPCAPTVRNQKQTV